MRAIRTLIVDDELAGATAYGTYSRPTGDRGRGECANGRDAARRSGTSRQTWCSWTCRCPSWTVRVLREVGVERAPAIVFVTAFDQYALRAFDVHALDYLLKPFTDERFRQSLERAKLQVRHGRLGELSRSWRPSWATESRRGRSRAVPRPSAGQVGRQGDALPVGEIEWIDAQGDYVRIHVGKSWHLLRETMKNLEGQLDATRFVGSTARPS